MDRDEAIEWARRMCRLYLAILLARLWSWFTDVNDALGIKLVGKETWDDVLDQETERLFGDVTEKLRGENRD